MILRSGSYPKFNFVTETLAPGPRRSFAILTISALRSREATRNSYTIVAVIRYHHPNPSPRYGISFFTQVLYLLKRFAAFTARLHRLTSRWLTLWIIKKFFAFHFVSSSRNFARNVILVNKIYKNIQVVAI